MTKQEILNRIDVLWQENEESRQDIMLNEQEIEELEKELEDLETCH